VPKTIDSGVLAAINSKNFPGVVLGQLHFDTIQRYTNSGQNIYWDEAGGGDEEYLGLGNMVSMSVLTESSEISAQTIQLTLSGIPNSTITDIFSNEYIGQPVYLWYGILDPDTYAIEGGEDGPVLIFAGSMDFGNISFGTDCTITVNATSRLADWERARGGRFNEAYQRRHVDPTDNGFNYVRALQNKPVSWGAFTVGDGDDSGGIGMGGMNMDGMGERG
jgi:hypothetical protein